MKRVFFIRHGQSEANINYDLLFEKEEKDIPLTNQGLIDAANAAISLKAQLDGLLIELKDATVLVSPWRRTMQTVMTIVNALGFLNINAPIPTPLITEHYMNLVGHKDNWQKFLDYKASGWNVPNFMDVQYEGGESLRGLFNRANIFVEQLRNMPDQTIIVVGHGKFIKMCMDIIDGKEPSDVGHPKNGEVILRSL